MKLRWYTVIVLAVVLIVYTAIGGVIFSQLESAHEDQMRGEILQAMQEFIYEGPCINMTSLGEAYAILMDMKDNGLDITTQGSLIERTQWDIRSAMFVSLQLIATIGFPSAAPRSSGGRAFTVPFAILGIPLFLVTAIGLGQLLNRLAEWFRLILIRTCCKEQYLCSPRVFRALLIGIAGTFFFIIIPSIIFRSIEPWSYGDSFYFAFITMTTIGFGDLTPSYNDVPWMSDSYRNWYRLAIAFWILLVSAWLAGVLVAVQTNISSVALNTLDRLQEKALRKNDNLRYGFRNGMQAGPQQSSYNQFYKQQQYQDDQMIYNADQGDNSAYMPAHRAGKAGHH